MCVLTQQEGQGVACFMGKVVSVGHYGDSYLNLKKKMFSYHLDTSHGITLTILEPKNPLFLTQLNKGLD